MLILVDDIKFESQEVFFSYVDTMFPDDSITDEASLLKVLTEGKPEVEFIVSDFNEIKEECKEFAKDIVHKLAGIQEVNKNFKLTMIET